MEITFLERVEADSGTDSIRVFAIADNKRIICKVPGDLLTSPRVVLFDAEEALRLFREQRSGIEAQLRRQIENGQFDDDGRITFPVPVGYV